MKIKLILPVINILVCLFLLAEAFMFSPVVRTVSINQLDSKRTRTKRTSYYNYFVRTSGNHKYEISEDIYNELKAGDSITISSSPLISMPVGVSYHLSGQVQSAKIGQLNTNQSEKYGLLISIFISLVVMVLQLKPGSQNRRLIFPLQAFAFLFTFTVTLFVVIEICLL